MTIRLQSFVRKYKKTPVINILDSDIEDCNDTIIRREIIKQGKSRAFINDTPVHLNILQEFSSQLINIHSQFHSLELKKSDFQMKVLDVLSGTYKDQEEFSINFSNLIHKKKKLNDLKVELSRSISEFDYNNFQLNELIELELNSHKYDELQNELIELSLSTYKWAIENGIAKEQARSVLPEGNTVSRIYMNGTLRSWIHYIQLREANGTQKEHMEIAKACAEVINKIFPMGKDLT